MKKSILPLLTIILLALASCPQPSVFSGSGGAEIRMTVTIPGRAVDRAVHTATEKAVVTLTYPDGSVDSADFEADGDTISIVMTGLAQAAGVDLQFLLTTADDIVLCEASRTIDLTGRINRITLAPDYVEHNRVLTLEDAEGNRLANQAFTRDGIGDTTGALGAVGLVFSTEDWYGTTLIAFEYQGKMYEHTLNVADIIGGEASFTLTAEEHTPYDLALSWSGAVHPAAQNVLWTLTYEDGGVVADSQNISDGATSLTLEDVDLGDNVQIALSLTDGNGIALSSGSASLDIDGDETVPVTLAYEEYTISGTLRDPAGLALGERTFTLDGAELTTDADGLFTFTQSTENWDAGRVFAFAEEGKTFSASYTVGQIVANSAAFAVNLADGSTYVLNLTLGGYLHELAETMTVVLSYAGGSVERDFTLVADQLEYPWSDITPDTDVGVSVVLKDASGLPLCEGTITAGLTAVSTNLTVSVAALSYDVSLIARDTAGAFLPETDILFNSESYTTDTNGEIIVNIGTDQWDTDFGISYSNETYDFALTRTGGELILGREGFSLIPTAADVIYGLALTLAGVNPEYAAGVDVVLTYPDESTLSRTLTLAEAQAGYEWSGLTAADGVTVDLALTETGGTRLYAGSATVNIDQSRTPSAVTLAYEEFPITITLRAPDGNPVPQTTFTLDGTDYTTNAAGQISLTESAADWGTDHTVGFEFLGMTFTETIRGQQIIEGGTSQYYDIVLPQSNLTVNLTGALHPDAVQTAVTLTYPWAEDNPTSFAYTGTETSYLWETVDLVPGTAVFVEMVDANGLVLSNGGTVVETVEADTAVTVDLAYKTYLIQGTVYDFEANPLDFDATFFSLYISSDYGNMRLHIDPTDPKFGQFTYGLTTENWNDYVYLRLLEGGETTYNYVRTAKEMIENRAAFSLTVQSEIFVDITVTNGSQPLEGVEVGTSDGMTFTPFPAVSNGDGRLIYSDRSDAADPSALVVIAHPSGLYTELTLDPLTTSGAVVGDFTLNPLVVAAMEDPDISTSANWQMKRIDSADGNFYDSGEDLSLYLYGFDEGMDVVSFDEAIYNGMDQGVRCFADYENNLIYLFVVYSYPDSPGQREHTLWIWDRWMDTTPEIHILDSTIFPYLDGVSPFTTYSVQQIDFSPDGSLLYLATSLGVIALNTADYSVSQVWPGDVVLEPELTLNSIFSANGVYVAGDGTVYALAGESLGDDRNYAQKIWTLNGDGTYTEFTGSLAGLGGDNSYNLAEASGPIDTTNMGFLWGLYGWEGKAVTVLPQFGLGDSTIFTLDQTTWDDDPGTGPVNPSYPTNSFLVPVGILPDNRFYYLCFDRTNAALKLVFQSAPGGPATEYSVMSYPCGSVDLGIFYHFANPMNSGGGQLPVE